jgi:hypothetical protein
MEYDDLLPLVKMFTGGGEKVGGSPINHICLSISHDEYHGIINRLESQGVKLTSAGENAFGAQGRAVISTYFMILMVMFLKSGFMTVIDL